MWLNFSVTLREVNVDGILRTLLLLCLLSITYIVIISSGVFLSISWPMFCLYVALNAEYR